MENENKNFGDNEYKNKLAGYTPDELLDIANHIDKEKYPNRYSLVLSEFKRRVATNNFVLDGKIIKIYKASQIWTGTYIGGPLVAGYLIAENFKILNEPDKIKITWLITILSTIIILVIYYIPKIGKIPSLLFPIPYTVIAYYLSKHYQVDKINNFIKNRGLSYSWMRIFWIGFIGSVITFLPVILIMLYTYQTNPTATKKYGTLQHEIYYNKSEVSELEVDKIADELTKFMFFDQNSKKSIFLKKVNNYYEIFVITINISWENPKVIRYFEQLRKDLQVQLTENKIIINLCQDIDISKVKIRLE